MSKTLPFTRAAALVAALSISLGLVGCSKKSAPSSPQSTLTSHSDSAANTPTTEAEIGEPETRHDSTGIVFETSVPKTERALLHHDLNYLSALQLSDDAELRKLMGLQDLSAASLQAWLGARMHYVFSETTLPVADFVQQRIEISREGDLYPNSTQLSLAGGKSWTDKMYKLASDINNQTNTTHALETHSDSSSSFTVMAANVGAGFYTSSKENQTFDDQGNRVGQIIRFKFNNDKAEVNSPRVGLIQIGNALVTSYLNKQLKADSNAIWRLSTFFHEAHHSDGNGHTLGFAHVSCPRGHDYAGSFACDLSTNGPYPVGAQFLAAMAHACTNCSSKETEALRLVYLDLTSRNLSKLDSAAGESARVAAILPVFKSDSVRNGLSAAHNKLLNTLLEILANHKAWMDDIINRGATTWDANPERVLN